MIRKVQTAKDYESVAAVFDRNMGSFIKIELCEEGIHSIRITPVRNPLHATYIPLPDDKPLKHPKQYLSLPENVDNLLDSCAMVRVDFTHTAVFGVNPLEYDGDPTVRKSINQDAEINNKLFGRYLGR